MKKQNNHINRRVSIDGKEGTVIDQNNEFVLIHFDHGSKIVFNSNKIVDKDWIGKVA